MSLKLQSYENVTFALYIFRNFQLFWLTTLREKTQDFANYVTLSTIPEQIKCSRKFENANLIVDSSLTGAKNSMSQDFVIQRHADLYVTGT